MEFCHAFMDALAKAIMSQEGVMEQWRRFSAEYKRKAMVIARCSVVSVGRTTGDMGVGITVLGCWRWGRRKRFLARAISEEVSQL